MSASRPAVISLSSTVQRGFTLIEMMVVALIIGIILTFAVVSFNRDVDQDVQTEAERLGALITLAAQESVLYSTEHALEFEHDRYKFLVLNEGQWQAPEDDGMLRERKLPKGISLDLYLEGNDFDLEEQAEEDDGGEQSVASGPRAYLLSSGEMTPFEAAFRHDDGEARYIVRAGITGKVEIERQ